MLRKSVLSVFDNNLTELDIKRKVPRSDVKTRKSLVKTIQLITKTLATFDLLLLDFEIESEIWKLIAR